MKGVWGKPFYRKFPPKYSQTCRISGGRVIRAFIAIKLPQEILDELGALQSELDRGWRGISWVKPESVHLTLKFLGEIEEKQVDEIYGVLRKAAEGIGPFRVSVEGVGGFPNARNPRVVWVGVREEANLLQLARNIDDMLDGIGFAREDRPFKPHLTLCRVKSFTDGKELGRLVERLAPGRIKKEFEAGSFILFKSVLNPKGAVYTEVRKIELKKS